MSIGEIMETDYDRPGIGEYQGSDDLSQSVLNTEMVT